MARSNQAPLQLEAGRKIRGETCSANQAAKSKPRMWGPPVDPLHRKPAL